MVQKMNAMREQPKTTFLVCPLFSVEPDVRPRSATESSDVRNTKRPIIQITVLAISWAGLARWISMAMKHLIKETRLQVNTIEYRARNMFEFVALNLSLVDGKR